MSPASPPDLVAAAEITQPKIEAPPLPSGGAAASPANDAGSSGTAATQETAASTSPQKEAAGRDVKEKIKAKASGLFDSGWTRLGKAIVGWTGVGAIAFTLGWAIAGRLAKRRLKKRLKSIEEKIEQRVRERLGYPVAIDSPPLPQVTNIEKHFVPFEQDRFGKAFAWAVEQIGRKYPGSIGALKAVEKLIQVQLAPKEDKSNSPQ